MAYNTELVMSCLHFLVAEVKHDPEKTPNKFGADQDQGAQQGFFLTLFNIVGRLILILKWGIFKGLIFTSVCNLVQIQIRILTWQIKCGFIQRLFVLGLFDLGLTTTLTLFKKIF